MLVVADIQWYIHILFFNLFKVHHLHACTLNNFSNWSLLFCCFLDIHKTNFVDFFPAFYTDVCSYQNPLKIISLLSSSVVQLYRTITDFHIFGVTSSLKIRRWLTISLLSSTRYIVAEKHIVLCKFVSEKALWKKQKQI